MREAEFGLVVLPGDLKYNVRAVPLGLVFDKVDLAVYDMPYDSLPWNDFGDLVGTAVNAFVVELKLSTQLVGPTSISCDHHARTLLMASKTSSGD